ncbi:hypothetical protein E2C01_068977 [Portunus trituberculatus]|uniref:Uncharacterized protein n=1 Tax=Portunus trituberculatus TaxID=210409 RepID=A0A5B7HQ94_PORTR|nr:hypothetical protein [Portunus trituberculatus]
MKSPATFPPNTSPFDHTGKLPVTNSLPCPVTPPVQVFLAHLSRVPLFLTSLTWLDSCRASPSFPFQSCSFPPPSTFIRAVTPPPVAA